MRGLLVVNLMAALAAAVLVSPAIAGPAEDQYAAAAGEYGQRRWQRAVQEFEQFLADYPQHQKAAEAHFFLGEALMQLKQVKEARPHFEAFAEKTAAQPDHAYAAHALFRRGECAYLLGDFPAARQHLTKFHAEHTQDPMNAFALPYLGDLALREQDGAKAQAFYTAALRQQAQTPLADQCYFGLARALQLQRRFDDAARYYQALIDKPKAPLADDALLQMGRLQYEREQYDPALATLQTLGEKYPQSELRPYAKYWSAMALLGKAEPEGDFAPAIRQLQQAAEVGADHPLTPAIRFQLGQTLRRAGRTEEAAALFQLVVEKSPQSAWADDAALGVMRIASDAGDFEAVQTSARDFAKHYPNSPLRYDARRLAGRAELKSEQYDAAAVTFEALLEELEQIAASTGSDNKQLSRPAAQSQADATRYLLALAYVGAKKFAAAEAVVDALKPDEEQDPQSAASLAAVRASALLGQEKYEEAIAPLRRYLRLNPNGPDANANRVHLTVALAQTNRLDEAQRVYDELAKTHTDRVKFLEATLFLADAAYSSGEKAWARELFTALTDENAPAELREKGLSGKAWCELDLKAPVRSAETFDRLLREFPESPLAPEAILARGSALEMTDDADEALAMYALILEKYPDAKQAPEVLFRAARVCHEIHQDKQAEQYLRRYIKDYPKQPNIDAALDRLGRVLQDQQRPQEAREVFQQIHDDYKRSRFWAGATFQLADAAAAENDYDRVKELVDQIADAGVADVNLETGLYLQGQVAGETGRWEAVADPMQRLLKQFPKSKLQTVAQYWIAEALYRQGKFAESAEHYALLAQQTQGQSDNWMAIIPLRRAQILAQQRKWAAAYAMAEKIAEEHPGFSQQFEADYVLGRCLANQAKFDEARQAYARVTTNVHGRRTETAAMAQWNIGETYFHQKDYDNAIRAYDRVELLYDIPRWQALALLQAGKCYQHLGQWNEAAARYEKVLDQFPKTDSTEEASRLLKVAREKLAAPRQPAAGTGGDAGGAEAPRSLDARGPARNESR